MSKTSDIGVGTAESTTGRREDLPNDLLPTFPQQTNDTLTILTSVSDHSISFEEGDRISERRNENTNDDISNRKTDNNFYDQTTNATIELKKKELKVIHQSYMIFYSCNVYEIAHLSVFFLY